MKRKWSKHRRNFRNPKSKPHHTLDGGGSDFKLQKLHATEFQSDYAVRLEDYYNHKYGQVVTPIAIAKTLAVISSDFKQNQKLWILNVAPSRHLKTQTTAEQQLIVQKSRLMYAGSDFTIHGLIRDYNSGRDIDGKCLLINDMTLLLASKAKQTRGRLIDALSELASEGRYIYSDFQHTYEVKARFSLIANITPHSFLVNRRQLLGNTFTERCLVLYHSLTDQEMSEANLKRETRNSMRIDRFKPAIHESDVHVSRQDTVRFDEYARRWRILAASSSSSSLFDMIKSAAVAHAILSSQREITNDQYRFLDMLEPHLQNQWETVKLRILQLAHEGRSIKDICNLLNQGYDSYRPYVSKAINEYRRMGVTSIKTD